jgi:dihydropteroate synthase
VERPLIMGVVNVTPDSFSDGGRYADPDAAVAHGLQLLREGADLLDVGGEATGPRAAPIDVAEELRRVLPVVERLAAAGAAVSIDTTQAAVAAAATARGARVVNDISGGLFDPAMGEAVAAAGATYICGHLRGRSLAEVFAREGSVTWTDVAQDLAERLAALPPEVASRAWLDPGVGFGKGGDPAANTALLRHAGDLGRALGGRTVVVGPSRKRFLRAWLGDPAPSERRLDEATALACVTAAQAGARVLRVHNVALLNTALTVYTQ